jgi:hypothetical protein
MLGRKINAWIASRYDLLAPLDYWGKFEVENCLEQRSFTTHYRTIDPFDATIVNHS